MIALLCTVDVVVDVAVVAEAALVAMLPLLLRRLLLLLLRGRGPVSLALLLLQPADLLHGSIIQ